MAAKSKRRMPQRAMEEASPAVKTEIPSLPPPRPPRPNKTLLLVSAVLLLAWFTFLGWMALFN